MHWPQLKGEVLETVQMHYRPDLRKGHFLMGSQYDTTFCFQHTAETNSTSLLQSSFQVPHCYVQPDILQKHWKCFGFGLYMSLRQRIISIQLNRVTKGNNRIRWHDLTQSDKTWQNLTRSDNIWQDWARSHNCIMQLFCSAKELSLCNSVDSPVHFHRLL